MKVQNKIAYFINFSIQEIPSIAYIASQTGGIIYTDSRNTYQWIRRDHPKLTARFFERVSAIKAHMRTSGVKVIVYPDYHIRHFRDLEGVRHVQVFHGTSDKVYDYRKDVLEYDLFFIPGQEAYERYRKSELLKRDTGLLIGYPKLDRVFRGELHREEELGKLKLRKESKTALYAPTWVDKEANSSWKKFRLPLVDDVPENVNLIIKLHPNIRKYREDEVKEIELKLAGKKNARLLDMIPDIVPLMAASDILIGDVSAVTREYLAFKKPFIFLSNKPRWLWNSKKIVLWECGEVVTKPKNIWKAIKFSLQNPLKYIDRISEHFTRTFYKPDGKAAIRAAEAIHSLIGEGD